MSRLEELINSLGTILVCYNEKQKRSRTEPNPDPNKSRESAIAILRSEDFEEEFSALNNKSISPNYKDRKEFLRFIKDEIVLFKKLLNRKNPFPSEEFEEYKKKVTVLFLDFKKLLTTKKSATYAVQENRLDKVITSLALPGLTESGWTGNSICYSGTLVKTELLDRFNIRETSSDEEIRKIATQLCDDHQNALLVLKLKATEDELKIIKSENTKFIQSLVQEHERKQQGLELEIKKQQEINTELRSELYNTKTALQNEQHKNRELHPTLDKTDQNISLQETQHRPGRGVPPFLMFGMTYRNSIGGGPYFVHGIPGLSFTRPNEKDDFPDPKSSL